MLNTKASSAACFRALIVGSLVACSAAQPSEPVTAGVTGNASVAAPTAEVFSWPEGKSAAVSLTYDDAIPSQRTTAAQQLRAAGVQGTFFLKGASDDLKQYSAQWQALLHDGHELASHTMHHPCDKKNDWVPEGFAVQDYDLSRMREELQLSIEQLESLGAQAPHTFAYPCGETAVGQPAQSYVGEVQQLFLAARGYQEGLASVKLPEPFLVPTVDGALPIEGLIEWVDRAEKTGQWLVLTFHGVGGDYLTVQAEAHAALLDHLNARGASVWVAPFGQVASHLLGGKVGG